MPLQTFSWMPTSAEESKETAVDTIAFGDGYELDIQRGLNPIRQVWSLSFEDCEPKIALQIRAFVDSKIGQERFYWTNPYGETIQVKCKPFSVRIDGNPVSLNLIFRQVFGVD